MCPPQIELLFQLEAFPFLGEPEERPFVTSKEKLHKNNSMKKIEGHSNSKKIHPKSSDPKTEILSRTIEDEEDENDVEAVLEILTESIELNNNEESDCPPQNEIEKEMTDNSSDTQSEDCNRNLSYKEALALEERLWKEKKMELSRRSKGAAQFASIRATQVKKQLEEAGDLLAAAWDYEELRRFVEKRQMKEEARTAKAVLRQELKDRKTQLRAQFLGDKKKGMGAATLKNGKNADILMERLAGKNLDNEAAANGMKTGGEINLNVVHNFVSATLALFASSPGQRLRNGQQRTAAST